MTLYSNTISSTQGDMNNHQTMSITEGVHNSNKFYSSEDSPIQGPTVLDGQTGRVKGVTDIYDLADNDRVVVEGIPMTVKQARDLGITLELPDTPRELSTKSQRKAVPQARQDAEPLEVDEGPIEGMGSDEERTVGITMADAFQLHTGLSADEVGQLGEDVALGLPADDEIWPILRAKGISRDAAIGAVDNATQSAEKAARRELGDKAYDELEKYVQQYDTVRRKVVNNGMMRIMGKKAQPWSQVLEDARKHSRR